MLADVIISSRGTELDIGGSLTSLSKGIEKAQRFELSNEVVLAAAELLKSKPSSLLAALPLCRLPYDKIWVEWLGAASGVPAADPVYAPTPMRVGCLAESLDDSGQLILMTWAWVHSSHAGVRGEFVNSCPICVVSDRRSTVNLQDAFDSDIMSSVSFADQNSLSSLIDRHKARSDDFGGDFRWSKLKDNKEEFEAYKELCNRSVTWVSPHGANLVSELFDADPDLMPQFWDRWTHDLEGEMPFFDCVLALMNSRNAIEHERRDLAKLNKARAKNGKRPLLDYSVTRLSLSKGQARRAMAAGLTREQARQHLVRGHFKLRVSKRRGTANLFWWSPFLRGDATRPLPRKEYEVIK